MARVTALTYRKQIRKNIFIYGGTKFRDQDTIRMVFAGSNIIGFEIVLVKYIIRYLFTILCIYMKQNIIIRNSNLIWGFKKFGHCIRS